MDKGNEWEGGPVPIAVNTDDEKFRPNGWPERSKFSGDWLHSDMKDVAYYCNYVFYKMVVEKGEMK